MFKVLIFGFLYVWMNGIVATKLLSGASWKCIFSENELDSSLILTRIDCFDYGGDWIESKYNFSNILNSMQVLFMV